MAEKEIKAMYFSEDEDFTCEEWEKKGKPEMWFRVFNNIDENVEVWEDRAYGQIQLRAKGEVGIGKDMAAVGDYVVFGPYYEGPLAMNKPYKLVSYDGSY